MSSEKKKPTSTRLTCGHVGSGGHFLITYKCGWSVSLWASISLGQVVLGCKTNQADEQVRKQLFLLLSQFLPQVPLMMAMMCRRQPDKPFLSQAALVTMFITAEGSLHKRGGHWTLYFVLFDLLIKLSVFQQGLVNVLVWFRLVYFAREILSLSNVNLQKSFLQRLILQHFKTLKYSPLLQFLRACFKIRKPYVQRKSKSQRSSVHL